MFNFNGDYLYHSSSKYIKINPSYNSFSLQNILKSGYILSKRGILGNACSNLPCGFNGYDYISLSKKINDKPDLNHIIKQDISCLSKDESYEIISMLATLEDQNDAYYKYVLFNPTFIFNTDIGEVETIFINDKEWRKYINDRSTRYSNLMGEFQIKDKIEIEKAIAISLPYTLDIFYQRLYASIHKNYDLDKHIKNINERVFNWICLIKESLPNIPIIDISSQKTLTKSLFNDIIT